MYDIKPWEINKIFNEALEAIAVSQVKKFYPGYIAKMTKLPLGVVIKKLEELEGQEALKIKNEFLCEECCRSILTINKNDFFDPEVTCLYCGTENNFDPLDAIPIIELDDGYRDSFSKKKSLTRELMLV